ncbi:hypothetical protein RvY_04766 [Ramazzottius varieornatus]|uniref:Glutathione S-transferase omega n=1 Tax=Ramazzottius varieornatus TaxID=947166 RepID=A0A1D1USR7_RAMVA|nr:hypothetical protein RvY_04766 [Ramazzottius varieornatus]
MPRYPSLQIQQVLFNSSTSRSAFRMVGQIPGESKDFKAGSEMPKINENALTVYSMRFCPYAERARLVLNVKHVPYDVINIDLKSKPEWFLKRNPLGKVPTIEEPGKRPLFESLIVAEYLDDQYKGDKKILPADHHERALQKVMIELVTQKVNTPLMAMVYKNESADKLLKGLEEVDQMLTGDFFAGKTMGFVDLMVWPWFERLESIAEGSSEAFKFEESRYPKIKAWMDRMLADPDVKATTYSKDDFVAFSKSVKEGKQNGNIGLE